MRYTIEYKDGGYGFADGTKDLISKLKASSRDTIEDVRKIFKSGVSETVMDIYGKHIGK